MTETGETTVYSTADISFIPYLKSCTAELCDASATLQTIRRRSVTDPNGGEIDDDSTFRAVQDFVHAMIRLHEYCREFVDADLSDRLDEWLESISISNSLDSAVITVGLELSSDYQAFLFDIGIKDTIPKAESFDFELFRRTAIDNKKRAGLPGPDDEDFDPLNSNFEILGFGSKSEYSFLYSNYVNKSFCLLSESRTDEAREFFYNVLSDFAPVFDVLFLDNCIRISSSIKENIPSESDYHTIFLLHRAEFARLMMRAGIHHQPDVIDNRAPSYRPAQKPAGMK